MGGVGRTRRGRGDRLVDEAFGLVLLEPLAAGTPVVAACSGGSVEIVSDERVGPLFEPYDAIGLARALADAIELAAGRATAACCRAHAAPWKCSWIVEALQAAYDSARKPVDTLASAARRRSAHAELRAGRTRRRCLKRGERRRGGDLCWPRCGS